MDIMIFLLFGQSVFDLLSKMWKVLFLLLELQIVANYVQTMTLNSQ